MKKINNTLSIKKNKENSLSIQFDLDGFSFSIHDNTSEKDVYFCEYKFESSQETPEQLLNKIQEIFKSDTYLQQDFSAVNVIHQNNLFTLVPNTYFDESKLETYLNFNVKSLSTDYLTFDDINAIESKNVYIPFVNINNYLFQNFGEFEYKHHLSVLIEKILKTPAQQEKTMFVNVSKSALDIVVTEQNKLLLANTFLYTTKEDFLYYILFVAEQLNLNPDIFLLYFMGKIEQNSDIYALSYQYIRNVHFLKSNNLIFRHYNASKHSNFILLG